MTRIYCQSVPKSSSQAVLDERIGILIPAYNEAQHLGELLDRCCAIEPAIVVVVDDASTDETSQVVMKAQRRHMDRRIVLVTNGRNLGKQGSVKRGLYRLVGEELDGVALIDGDLQHDPGELPGLSSLLRIFDVVIGVRDRAEMPWQRRFSNWCVNTGFRLISGVDFMDVLSGLRLYRKPVADALAQRLRFRGGFGLEHESLTAVARYTREASAAVSVAAAPISCSYGEETSHVRVWDILRLTYETFRQARRFRRAVRQPSLLGAPS